MNLSFELSIEVSEQYDFNKEALTKIEKNPWVKNQWPLVYFIQNQNKNPKIAYVGESTNAYSRIKNHLANPERCKLNKISIIGSSKFNKSATLDIESSLIQYITAEGTYELQNGNYGLINHNYYQQDLYKNLFKEVWSKLIDKKIVTKSLADIENSELFKYSPYKSLNEDQYNSVLEILNGLTSKKSNRIFIKGSAGTGKTILATYLIKLLNSDIEENSVEDYNEDEAREINFIKEFRKKYPNAKIGLVIAMTSLRESLEKVFKKIPGLKSSMVINPSETFKSGEKYDLLIVDEAHRLRQYKNISWRGAFKKNNQKLGLGDTGNELDWILANSKNQVFFYDSAQSVKPSDVDAKHFEELLNSKDVLKLELKSQMRVQGKDSNNYISFVDELLHVKKSSNIFSPNDYDLKLFDSLDTLYNELTKKEIEFGLCRLVAGYSWEWLSDPNRKPKPNLDAIDIEIDGMKFQWNHTFNDWVNSPNAFEQVGCIHTVQGYDLNYAGVIFGREINYNPKTEEIEIDSSKYYDTYGRIGVDAAALKNYIVNIYKTLMYRGIKGTYVYACNKELNEYLKLHIESFKNEMPFRILKFEDVKPYVNSIPLLDIYAAAGAFSELQHHQELTWVEPPFEISANKKYFICKVLGESMNLKIPSGSYCLFRTDEGGSRNGKIVLVQSSHVHDSEFGAGYTVKEYHSKKDLNEFGWKHEEIVLKPRSQSADYKEIKLKMDELTDFKVLGVLERVITAESNRHK
jgi:DUF2075 family protein/DNA replication protein DnaC